MIKQKVLFGISTMSLLGFSCQTPVINENDETTSEKTNFIVILCDDLGYNDVGAFGATDIKTPYLDRMAAEGMKLSSFYSGSPVCSPSRAALMTGRYPERMGVNGVFFPESFTGMPAEEVTVAEVLKDNGYTTGIVGKWHLGHMQKFLPLQQGFDEYFGIPYSNDMESVVYMRGNEVEAFEVDQRYTTQKYTQEALAFINHHKEEPFFLYLAHSMPHVPIYASPEFEGRSEKGLYGDVIEEIDWSVGQIMNQLDSLDLDENTLVIFTSDNGPWLVMREHAGSAAPLREGKQYTFEGGVRVPAIAWWKKQIPAGSEYKNLVSIMDIMPTFAAISGAELPDVPIDGVNILPVLKGEGERIPQELLFYYLGDLRGYRDGNWKLKLPFDGSEPVKWKKHVDPHPLLLTNLDVDLGERENLAEEYPEVVERLKSKMDSAVEALGPLPPSLMIRSPADESHFDYLRDKYGEDFYYFD